MKIVFENEGEIDPRLIMLIGVNVKESDSAIGFFGTGLKYAVASLLRWGESISIQSGANEYTFAATDTEIRGKQFGVLEMCSRFERTPLGFTTELGKRWEPWMVYRELWCNAHDEPGGTVYEVDNAPPPKAGRTRVIVAGDKIAEAHASRSEFILDRSRLPLRVIDGLEIYEGAGERIFYRGIAVQTPDKPSVYTYNITEHLWLTEDRTAGSWSTDPVIARGLSQLDDKTVIDNTLLAPSDALESGLDYDYARHPSEVWTDRARAAIAARPLDVPNSVRDKFVERTAEVCPSCGKPL